jgi:hypothetical protein
MAAHPGENHVMNTRSLGAGVGGIALLLASVAGTAAQSGPASASTDVVGPVCVSLAFADGAPPVLTAGAEVVGDSSMVVTILLSTDCAPFGDSVAPVVATAYEDFADYLADREGALSSVADDMPDDGLDSGWYKDLRTWANTTIKHLKTFVVAPCFQEEYDAAMDWARKVRVAAQAGIDAITAYDKGSYSKAIRLMDKVSPLVDDFVEAKDYLDETWSADACEAAI